MQLSRDEAQEALLAVRTVTDQVRQRIGGGSTPSYMILWGGVWFLGFLGSHFVGGKGAGWLWLGLSLVGAGLSAYIGFRSGTQVRSPGSARISLGALASIGFCLLWLWILQPASEAQASLFIVTFAMFGYVLLGLWVERTATFVGLLVTALALLGYFLFRPFFNLWMAFLGGGTLMVSGLYTRRSWGRRTNG
jgi:hypothetical protein